MINANYPLTQKNFNSQHKITANLELDKLKSNGSIKIHPNQDVCTVKVIKADNKIDGVSFEQAT